MNSFVLSRPSCSCAHTDDGTSSCSFRVAWAINPHMKIGAANPDRACAQHSALTQALRTCGARVLRLPFIHGAFDSVFMKDSAILLDRHGQLCALPTTFRYGVREVETKARSAQLNRAGFTLARPLPTPLEGGDVQLVSHRGLALLGHGVRSERASSTGLAYFLGCEVVPLELRDPELFHLDVALTVLGDDTLVYCREAFTPASQRALEALRFKRMIEVPLAEARQFSINIVEVRGAIITGTASTEMTALWHSLGRRVVVSPLDQFQLAGGSAACLVARVQSMASAHRLAA
jgi:N-dimethylarginine dimethylaminohydrolase